MTAQLEGHTVKRFDGELGHVHMLMVEMGGLVLDQAKVAVYALQEEDLDAARRVLDREREVNALELQIDDELLGLIARRGPVARDLRATMAFSKSVADLERMGDNAQRIAQIALTVYEAGSNVPSAIFLRDVSNMARVALTVAEEAIRALDRLDAEASAAVQAQRRELDSEFQSGVRRLSTFVLEDARTVGHAIAITLVLKALERLGDHAVSIAEQVIYLIEGRDVRHPGAASGPASDAGSGDD